MEIPSAGILSDMPKSSDGEIMPLLRSRCTGLLPLPLPPWSLLGETALEVYVTVAKPLNSWFWPK